MESTITAVKSDSKTALGPTVWLGVGEVGERVVADVQRWLRDPSDVVARVTRTVVTASIPAVDHRPEGDHVLEALRASVREVLAEPALRDASDQRLLVPSIWIAGDMAGSGLRHLADWLPELFGYFHNLSLTIRVSLLLRDLTWSESERDRSAAIYDLSRVVEDFSHTETAGAGSLRIFIVSDRDGRGALYEPDECVDAMRHFAEFITLTNAPHALHTDAARIFRPGGTIQSAVDDVWEVSPLFGSIRITRLQIQGTDPRSRIDPMLRQKMGKALAVPTSATWIPPVPTYHQVAIARQIEWKYLDLPRWRFRQFEGTATELRRAAIEIDRWNDTATKWRRQTLVNFMENSAHVQQRALAARTDYLHQVQELGSTALESHDVYGLISPLRRVIERTSADLRFARVDDIPDPTSHIMPTSDEEVAALISPAADVLSPHFPTFADQLARRVPPLQVLALAIVAGVVAWFWTIMAAEHWDLSLYGKLGRQGLPDTISDPLLQITKPIGRAMHAIADRWPLTLIHQRGWIGLLVAAIILVTSLLVIRWDRNRMERAFARLSKRALLWRENALELLPQLLAASEDDANRRILRQLADDVQTTGDQLNRLEHVAVNPRSGFTLEESAFTKPVPAPSPAIIDANAEDIQKSVYALRRAISPRWMSIEPSEFEDAIIDHIEPIAARGSRTAQDPRADVQNLVRVLRAELPSRASLLLAPNEQVPEDRAPFFFATVAAVPKASAKPVAAMLDDAGRDDVLTLSLAPERIAFAVGVAVDLDAKRLFGEQPDPPPILEEETLDLDLDGHVVDETADEWASEDEQAEEPEPLFVDDDLDSVAEVEADVVTEDDESAPGAFFEDEPLLLSFGDDNVAGDEVEDLSATADVLDAVNLDSDVPARVEDDNDRTDVVIAIPADAVDAAESDADADDLLSLDDVAVDEAIESENGPTGDESDSETPTVAGEDTSALLPDDTLAIRSETEASEADALPLRFEMVDEQEPAGLPQADDENLEEALSDTGLIETGPLDGDGDGAESEEAEPATDLPAVDAELPSDDLLDVAAPPDEALDETLLPPDEVDTEGAEAASEGQGIETADPVTVTDLEQRPIDAEDDRP